MKAAEKDFNEEHQDDVWFGVGTYGSNDPMRGLGNCYRMKAEGVEKDLIV